jgi:amino acid transporter
VLIVTSLLASLLAFHNATNRYGLAMAEEGVLSAALGRIHPKHRSPYVAGIAQTVLAVMVVVAFAAAGADPYTQLLLWVNTPGMLALVALQLLAAVAVPLYFRRIAHGEGVLRTVVAPAMATLLLGTALWLVIANINLLTGASSTVDLTLILLVPAAFAAGLGYALRVRAARPRVYAHFAAEPVDAEPVDAEPTPAPAEARPLTTS